MRSAFLSNGQVRVRAWFDWKMFLLKVFFLACAELVHPLCTAHDGYWVCVSSHSYFESILSSILPTNNQSECVNTFGVNHWAFIGGSVSLSTVSSLSLSSCSSINRQKCKNPKWIWIGSWSINFAIRRAHRRWWWYRISWKWNNVELRCVERHSQLSSWYGLVLFVCFYVNAVTVCNMSSLKPFQIPNWATFLC